MIDLIIWWVGAVVIFVSAFCVILYVAGIFIQEVLNFFWQKLLRANGMIDIQKAWSFYEKNKEKGND